MYKCLFVIIFFCFISKCDKDKYAKNNRWLYVDGYYVGDVIFTSKMYRFSNDTIYVNQTKIMLINKVSNHYMIIKTIDDSVGVYKIM